MDICRELNKIVHSLSSIKTKIINSSWTLVVYTAFLVIIFLSVIALIFAWGQILSIIYPTIKESHVVGIFNFLKFFSIFKYDIDSLSPTQYSAILSSASSVVALLVTMWFAAFSTYSLGKYRRDLKRQSIVQTEPVYRDGVDDLKIMLDYYKNAGYVAVFARDFNWIGKNGNPALTEKIINLANENKIDLFSWIGKEEVKQAINNEEVFNLLDERKRFHFDQNSKDIYCSLVKTEGAQVFLYRSKQRMYGRENYICIIQGVNEGQYLLEVIIRLLRSTSRDFFDAYR